MAKPCPVFCRATRHASTAVAAPHLAGAERFLTNPSRVAHRDELVPLIETVMRQRTTGQWQQVLGEAGVPHAPLWNYADLFSGPQAEARHWRVGVRDPWGRPIDLMGSPFHVSTTGGPGQVPPATCPPELGEDTEAVLRELCGLDGEEVRRLREAGVVGGA